MDLDTCTLTSSCSSNRLCHVFQVPISYETFEFICHSILIQLLFVEKKRRNGEEYSGLKIANTKTAIKKFHAWSCSSFYYYYFFGKMFTWVWWGRDAPRMLWGARCPALSAATMTSLLQPIFCEQVDHSLIKIFIIIQNFIFRGFSVLKFST